MWVVEWLKRIYQEERFAVIVTLVVAGVLLLSALFSYIKEESGIYLGFAAIVGGVTGMVFLTWEIERAVYGASLSLLLIFGGSLFFLLRGTLILKRRKRERKRLREEGGKRLQYTLPERENAFIRTRLNTVLNMQNDAFNADMGGGNMEKPITLGHAWGLLVKVKSASLTAAERLQTEEIERGFSLYTHKESWTSADLCAINDLFAVLLKLSAKYGV